MLPGDIYLSEAHLITLPTQRISQSLALTQPTNTAIKRSSTIGMLLNIEVNMLNVNTILVSLANTFVCLSSPPHHCYNLSRNFHFLNTMITT